MRIIHSILLLIPILTGGMDLYLVSSSLTQFGFVVVVSVPLDVQYDKTTNLNQKEQNNKDRLELAKADGEKSTLCVSSNIF